MKYYVGYQYMPKGKARPLDDGPNVQIEFEATEASALLPNVGDYVHIDASTKQQEGFSGKVRSRLFSYLVTPANDVCMINIVVEETDDDWGNLIKE